MLSMDFTDRNVKMVRGSLAGSKIRVIQVETLELPAGLIENGFVVDIPMLASELLEFLQTKDIKEKEIIAEIGSGLILNKELVLPKPKKMTNSYVIETMIQSNMNIASDYNISYTIVGEDKDENNNDMIRVMATAVPQRLADGYTRLFSHLGLTLRSLYVSANCISRLVENSQKLMALMPLMMVHVEQDFININLYDEGRLLLSRRVTVDMEETKKDSDALVQMVYDNVFRMVQFMSGRRDGKPLKEITFYGTIPDFILLNNAMSSFNTSTHILSAPGNVVSFCEFDFAEYADAISAFFKTKREYDRVDLLQASAAKEKKKKSGSGVALLALCLLGSLAITGGAYFYLNYVNDDIKSQTAMVRAEIEDPALKQRVDILNAKINKLEDISRYSNNIEVAKYLFDFQPVLITEVLDKLTAVMPEDMYIKGDIDFNGYNINATFVCHDDSLPSEYVRLLNEQGYFESINYTGYTGSGEDEKNMTYTFSLSMLLKGGNGYEAE
ncbi:MAG: competence protein ComA [Oscillospiraceae bacterium]|nr:competence protein ComA [Oscillospiraceae bacterium]